MVVGLDLHDSSADAVNQKGAAEQIGSDRVDAPREELAPEHLSGRGHLEEWLVVGRFGGRLQQMPRTPSEVAQVDASFVRVLHDAFRKCDRFV